MTYNDGPMARHSPALVDYGEFDDGPSALHRDYLAGAASVAPFFEGGHWDLAAIAQAAERTAAYPHPRREMAESLVRQQLARGAAAAAERAATLRDEKAVAVVTGQQAVLFGGPLYVLYKALAAMRLAAALQAQRHAPVVPIFWVAANDHDFAEIREASVLDAAGRLRTLRYAPRDEPHGLPASSILLDDTITKLLEEFAEALPAGAHREALLARLAACYRPGASMSEAFGALLSSLLPGLVVLDPTDPAVKSLMIPILKRELGEGSPTSRLAAPVGQALVAAGYHQQFPVREGFLNAFVEMEGQRRALALSEQEIEVRSLSRRISIADALAALEADPSSWSPGALLRPLIQDHLLPTAAYVGGPAEIAYHAQIGPSYAHFGIPRPVAFPRPGVTLVESSQARALEAEGLALTDLRADPEALLARWAREANPGIEPAFARARETIAREMEAIGEALGALDPTLRAAADSAKGRTLHQVGGLEEKAMRALKKRDLVRTERLRRTRDALFPGGAPQERALGLVGLVARHGEAVISELRERIDPWAKGHQVIAL